MEDREVVYQDVNIEVVKQGEYPVMDGFSVRHTRPLLVVIRGQSTRGCPEAGGS